MFKQDFNSSIPFTRWACQARPGLKLLVAEHRQRWEVGPWVESSFHPNLNSRNTCMIPARISASQQTVVFSEATGRWRLKWNLAFHTPGCSQTSGVWGGWGREGLGGRGWQKRVGKKGAPFCPGAKARSSTIVALPRVEKAPARPQSPRAYSEIPGNSAANKPLHSDETWRSADLPAFRPRGIRLGIQKKTKNTVCGSLQLVLFCKIFS